MPAAKTPTSTSPADSLTPEEIAAYRAASDLFQSRFMCAGNPVHRAEPWLIADVSPTYDAMVANPARAVSVSAARDKLARHHARQCPDTDSIEREVVFAPEAARDVLNFYESTLAMGYTHLLALQVTGYLIDFCAHLALGAHLTSHLDGFRPGLRLTNFRLGDPVSFHLTPTELVIDRILFASAGMTHLPRRPHRQDAGQISQPPLH
jgi:hypothetical protein